MFSFKATFPADAIIPACRIPPPNALRILRASLINSLVPHSIDPIGDDKPFDNPLTFFVSQKKIDENPEKTLVSKINVNQGANYVNADIYLRR